MGPPAVLLEKRGDRGIFQPAFLKDLLRRWRPPSLRAGGLCSSRASGDGECFWLPAAGCFPPHNDCGRPLPPCREAGFSGTDWPSGRGWVAFFCSASPPDHKRSTADVTFFQHCGAWVIGSFQPAFPSPAVFFPGRWRTLYGTGSPPLARCVPFLLGETFFGVLFVCEQETLSALLRR